MTFESIWLEILKKKPDLVSHVAVIEINSEQFKKLLRQVYEKGVNAGKNSNSLFEDLFGKLRK